MREKPLVVYVAGPISGRYNENREAFERARREIEINPSIEAIIPHDIYQASAFARRCPALLWCQAMVFCLPMVEAADYIYLLEGWQDSSGARREESVARGLGKRRLFEVWA